SSFFPLSISCILRARWIWLPGCHVLFLQSTRPPRCSQCRKFFWVVLKGFHRRKAGILFLDFTGIIGRGAFPAPDVMTSHPFTFKCACRACLAIDCLFLLLQPPASNLGKPARKSCDKLFYHAGTGAA
ncbi:unnamed protein product, partial [Phaeothamnion confervicola]